MVAYIPSGSGVRTSSLTAPIGIQIPDASSSSSHSTDPINNNDGGGGGINSFKCTAKVFTCFNGSSTPSELAAATPSVVKIKNYDGDNDLNCDSDAAAVLGQVVTPAAAQTLATLAPHGEDLEPHLHQVWQ